MSFDHPARILSVRITVVPPPALSAQRHAALPAVASHCTVHNTLRRSPEEMSVEPAPEPEEP